MKLGSIAGVAIKINFGFLLLAVIYTCLGLGREIVIIVSALLIHEIAHVVVALMLGIKIKDVELMPFGGQARIDDFTGLNPEKEIYMALAGPVASLSLAGLFYYSKIYFTQLDFDMFIQINLLLGLFNLLPALPLDGGRVLRAVLSPGKGFKKATRIAARSGKLIALLLMGWGGYLTYTSLTGANFIIISILLFWAAGREEKFLAYTFMRFLVNKKSELSQKGMLPCSQVVGYEDTLVKEILNSTRPTYYLLVIMLDKEHHVLGMITEAELIECLFEQGPAARLEHCR